MATRLDEMQNMLADIDREEALAKENRNKAPVSVATDAASMKAMLLEVEAEEDNKIRPLARRNRGDGINTEPLDPPPSRTIVRELLQPERDALRESTLPIGDPESLKIKFESVGPPDIVKKAADAGVEWESPSPVGHALASLAYNPEERVKAYRNKLSEHFKTPITVEVGPDTGAIEWLNPKTGRFALAEPPHQGMLANIAGAAGGSMVMVPELMGGALGAFVMKSPTSASAGGGLGALIGEAGRVFLGQRLGINATVSDADIMLNAGWKGAGSAAVGEVFNQGLRVVQFMRHAFNGDAVGFAAREGFRLGTSIEESAKIQDQINDAIFSERIRLRDQNANLPERLRTDIPDSKFVATLGEGAGDTDLLMKQHVIENSPTFQAQFGAFDQERQSALVEFYDTIGRPFNKSNLSETQTAERVKEMGKTQLGYEHRRINEHLARYQADASEALSSVQTTPLHQLGDVARGVGDQALASFDAFAEKLATNIRTLAGEAKFVENTNTAEVFGKLDVRSRNIFLGALRRDTRKKQMIPAKTIEGPQGEAQLNPLFDPTTKRTFSESWDTLSRLKQVVREGDGSDVDIGALKKMAGAIEADLYNSAGPTELGSLYRDFTQWYRVEKTRLNQGTVGKILKRQGTGGEFTMADEQVFKNVFPATNVRGGGGIRETEQFMDLIKHDPEAISGFRTAIADDWRHYVVQDGRLNPARHQEWLNMHREQLGLKFQGLGNEERRALASFDIQPPKNQGEALYTRQELKAMNTAEGFEKQLQAREASAKAALEAVNKRFNAKLTDLKNPGQLLNLIRADLDGNAARDLMQELRVMPDVRRGFQAAYLRDMREKIMPVRNPTTRDSILSPNALTKFLYGKADESEKGQIRVLRELYGDEYVNGITTLEKALQITARKVPSGNTSKTAFWWTVGVRVAQAKYGVISRPARIATAARSIQQASADMVMARAIMHPSNMKLLMSIWHTDIRDRKTVAVLSQLGLGAGDLTPQED